MSSVLGAGVAWLPPNFRNKPELEVYVFRLESFQVSTDAKADKNNRKTHQNVAARHEKIKTHVKDVRVVVDDTLVPQVALLTGECGRVGMMRECRISNRPNTGFRLVLNIEYVVPLEQEER